MCIITQNFPFIIPNRAQLSEHERKPIIASRKCGMSGRKIAKKINRSKTVIYNLLKNPKEYGKKKHTGRPPILTMCQCNYPSSLLRKAELY